MSQKRVKQFRDVTRKLAKELHSEIEQSVIDKMMSKKLWDRMIIAYKIIRKKVEIKNNGN